MNRTEFEMNIRRRVDNSAGRIEVPGAEDEIYEALLLQYTPWPLLDDGTKNKVAYGSVSAIY